MAIRPLSDTEIDEIVAKLGFASRPPADAAGLSAVYSAWCRTIPFDNLRKLVALHYGLPQIPGIEPSDFFAAWQLTGAGATCWGSNNALHALLTGLGFDARLMAASMFDGEKNHGTTIVAVAGRDVLVDTSVHGDVPLVMVDGETAAVDHGGYRSAVRQDDRGWLVEFPSGDGEGIVPCRLLAPMDHPATERANEKSRGWSPFNTAITVGINDATGVWKLRGSVLTRFDEAGVTSRELSDREVDDWLVEVSGHAPQLVAEVRAILPPSRPPSP